MTGTPPICLVCKHYKEDEKGKVCAAFPDIPNEIYQGTNKHKSKLPNQANDIIFELDEKKLKEYKVQLSDFD